MASTKESGEVWSAYLAIIADATLQGRTDWWYMAANIPSSRRRLLDRPMSDEHPVRLAGYAAGGFHGFVLG